MNTAYITAEALTALYEKYPNAYSFLLHQNLIEEARQLRQELERKPSNPLRAAWIVNRLQQLKDY